MKRNHVWVLQGKEIGFSKWVTIDAYDSPTTAKEMLHNYKCGQERWEYRIRKYVSEEKQ